ncbi:uncharacterized mitochondrial carrier C19G12.05 isoform X4 [Pyrus x bretschneideri]|uniref:uncharacterized mitochondrial carrier C19G12.05 isoform X4 n=1 Tax=Pyrus x bretschneideri TaxID=225117 RepID=UPI00202DCFAE|nr:uncharacterized mitochondrial carrier C19G12.05 isoform X4 [Pyrus x bretschneideri]
MATQSSNSSERHALPDTTHKHFFEIIQPATEIKVKREFLWGAVAGAFGEGMKHPVDTVKTRIQSQAILSASQKPKSIMHMVRAVWAADGLRDTGLYLPGMCLLLV